MRFNIPALGGGEKCGRSMLMALLCVLSLTKGYGCGDLSLPTAYFEGVSEKGSVSHWEQLGSLDLGDIKVPLIIGFQTYLPYTSPELGSGWTLPLFDSNMVQRDEGTFDMVRPDGSWEIFQRDATNPNILHGSGGLLAEINGDIITVNSTCGSGWKMVFNQGKLISLGKGSHTLNIVRDPLGRATDLMDGPTRVLALEQDQVTGLTKSITMGDKRFELSYDAKPRVERVNGVNLVGGVDQSLHKITYPDGKSETYDFAVTDKLLPNLRITDAQGKERMIVWGTDGKIIRDGEWTYTIKPQEDPDARFAAIERKRADGKSELWNKDEAKGEEVTQGLDGTKRVKTWFTSGVLAGRQRKEEQIINGKSQLVRQCTYDDQGNLVRELLPDGSTNKFTYFSDRKTSIQTSIKDGKIAYSIEYKDGKPAIENFADGKLEITYDAKGRQEKNIFNGKLHSIKSYADDNSWVKDTIYDGNNQNPIRVFYNEYNKEGKIVLEKISELTNEHSEITRNYVYNELVMLVKKFDSQHGTTIYLAGEVNYIVKNQIH